MTFRIDGVLFTCHGRRPSRSTWRSSPGGRRTPAGRSTIPGSCGSWRTSCTGCWVIPTYAEVTRHRRVHRTPDAVMQQIIFDLIEDTADRPLTRPSPSPAGAAGSRLAAGRLALAGDGAVARGGACRAGGHRVGPAGCRGGHLVRGPAGPGTRTAGGAGADGQPHTPGRGRELADWLDAVEVIWTDEARDRLTLKLLAVIAATGGWKGFEDFEDPADLLDGDEETATERAADPDERAAQVAAFLAAIR